MPFVRTVQRHSKLRPRGPQLIGARVSWLIAGALCALLLPGCPVFPDQGCFVDGDCAQGYACAPQTGLCVPSPRSGPSCAAPEDCGFNETCSQEGVCRSGDCTFSGCVEGYACDRDDGVWACVQVQRGSGGMGGDSSDNPPTPPGGAPSSDGGAGGDTAGSDSR